MRISRTYLILQKLLDTTSIIAFSIVIFCISDENIKVVIKTRNIVMNTFLTFSSFFTNPFLINFIISFLFPFIYFQ